MELTIWANAEEQLEWLEDLLTVHTASQRRADPTNFAIEQLEDEIKDLEKFVKKQKVRSERERKEFLLNLNPKATRCV